MNDIRSLVRYWFNKRFVRLIEIVGYLVVTIIAGAVLYSCMTQIEIKAPASGTLQPFRVDVTCNADGVFVSYSVPAGAAVEEGDEVCRVVTEPQSVARARAHIGLNETIDSLKTAHQPELVRARGILEELRDEIVYAPATEPLRAPATGRVQLIDAMTPGTVFSRGDPLATVRQFDRFIMDGTIAGNNADKVESGQTARVTIDIDGSVTLAGNVTERGEGNAVSLEFGDIPSDVRARFQTLGERSVGAEIVVGKQSPFLYLFARRQ